MRFLIDAQLPPALARHLASLGHEATHVSELGMVSARDREIWNRAAAEGSVIVAGAHYRSSFARISASPSIRPAS